MMSSTAPTQPVLHRIGFGQLRRQLEHVRRRAVPDAERDLLLNGVPVGAVVVQRDVAVFLVIGVEELLEEHGLLIAAVDPPQGNIALRQFRTRIADVECAHRPRTGRVAATGGVGAGRQAGPEAGQRQRLQGRPSGDITAARHNFFLIGCTGAGKERKCAGRRETSPDLQARGRRRGCEDCRPLTAAFTPVAGRRPPRKWGNTCYTTAAARWSRLCRSRHMSRSDRRRGRRGADHQPHRRQLHRGHRPDRCRAARGASRQHVLRHPAAAAKRWSAPGTCRWRAHRRS